MVYFTEIQVVDYTSKDAILLLVFVICTIFKYGLFAIALSLTTGVIVSMAYSSSLVYMLLSQYYVLQDYHAGHRDWLEVTGAICVIIGSLLTPIVESITQYIANIIYLLLQPNSISIEKNNINRLDV